MSSNNTGSLEIYQLRIVLKDVSPLIWRRILVKDTTSIADLHYILGFSRISPEYFGPI